MKTEIKNEWIKRLLSGAYKKSEGFIKYKLNEKLFYCVMGVLFEMALEAGVFTEEEIVVRNGYSNYRLYPVANKEFLDWSGLDEKYPRIEGTRINILNDKGYDFEQLAEIIDKYL